jgi:hypothetical protein
LAWESSGEQIKASALGGCFSDCSHVVIDGCTGESVVQDGSAVFVNLCEELVSESC